MLTFKVPYNQIIDFYHGPVFEDFVTGLLVKMSINLNRLEYFDKILHTHWYWQDVAQEIVKCHLGLAEALPGFKFWKKKWKKCPIIKHLIFVTGLFVKILSPACSWKLSITLNRLEYFDKILHTHWYWQDVDQQIVKCHLGLAEALPRFKFWKSENSPISWTEWNISINFCVNIDIDKI